jgi:hypothetical protein
MTDIIIGIDPGAKSGGICLMDNQGSRIDVAPMPEIELLADWLEAAHKAAGKSIHVFLEKAQSMPGNGGAHMFSYGCHFGELKAVLMMLALPYTLVPPQTWCKVMHAGASAGKPKERSREVVRRLFPQVRLTPEGSRATKGHEGMMDALLIAEYGRRTLARTEATKVAENIIKFTQPPKWKLPV